MSKVSYREQVKNHTLNRYIRTTSIVSYHDHWRKGEASTHCEALKDLYDDNPEGLTDRECQYLLRAKGYNLDAGSIPARRHDLNKLWLGIREEEDLCTDLPATFIVSFDNRKNPSGKSAIVWGINPQLKR